MPHGTCPLCGKHAAEVVNENETPNVQQLVSTDEHLLGPGLGDNDWLDGQAGVLQLGPVDPDLGRESGQRGRSLNEALRATPIRLHADLVPARENHRRASVVDV